MSGYDYVNGCYAIHTEIMEGFKRFHKCNAQERHFFTYSDYYELIPECEVWQFVSYATPIVQIIHFVKSDDWLLTFNGNPYGYSPTTSRQFNRWLREHERWFGISAPKCISDGYEKAKRVTSEIKRYRWSDNVELEYVSQNIMTHNWR